MITRVEEFTHYPTNPYHELVGSDLSSHESVASDSTNHDMVGSDRSLLLKSEKCCAFFMHPEQRFCPKSTFLSNRSHNLIFSFRLKLARLSEKSDLICQECRKKTFFQHCLIDPFSKWLSSSLTDLRQNNQELYSLGCRLEFYFGQKNRKTGRTCVHQWRSGHF